MSGMGRKRPTGDQEWRRWSGVGLLIRATVVAVPALTGIATSWAISRALPTPGGVLATVLWWVAVTAATITVLLATERVARRLLPLATLFSLSLVFPDRAPSRFKVARQIGRPADLRRRLAEAQRDGAIDEAQRMQTVLELVTALAVHDRQTRGHSERVRVFTDLIAEELKLSAGDRARLRWASLLHDVGKLNVSHDILTKPERPTASEWEALRRHPEEGARLVASILPWLDRWGPAVAQHHERWDGMGYPRGLAGEQISLGGRIVAVADAFEVMTAPRPYKRPIRPAAAREELVRCSGTHFDPDVVRAFLNISVGRLWRAMGPGAIVAQLPLIWPLGRALSGLGGRAAPAVAGATTATTLITGGFIAPPQRVQASPPPHPGVAGTYHPGGPAGAGAAGSTIPTTLGPIPVSGGHSPSSTGSTPAAGGTTVGGAPVAAGPGIPTTPQPPSGVGGVLPPLPAPSPAPTAPPLPPPNVPPVVTIPTLGTVVEGGTLAVSGSFSDPDSHGWTATVDYGDGSGPQPLALAGNRFQLDHTYAATCTCTVAVAVTDDSGAVGRATAAVAVTGSPIVVGLNTTVTSLGLLQAYTNAGAITDSDGSAESFAGTVDYGDGTVQPLVITNGTFSLSHFYLLPLTYTVTVTVHETDDGSQTSANATVHAL
jgi:hypothetical protein